MRKFIGTWFVIIASFVIVGGLAMGYNSITGTIDVGAGFAAVWSLAGGLVSFIAIIGGILLLALAVAALFYMSNHNYENDGRSQMVHVTIGLIVLVAVAVIGIKWIHLPSGSGWAMLGVISLVTAVSIAVTLINKNATTVHATPTN